MKKLIAKIVLMSLLVTPLGAIFPLVANAADPNWDTTGSYVINMNYLGTDYAHDMNLTQDNTGNLTGNGGSPSGANVYTWTITSGTVSADTIDFMANYTATSDAVTPQTVLHVIGTIASNGTMSGTWSDNYQGGQRSGTWTTASGMADYTYVTTNPATAITSTDATLNGTNGGTAATGHSFWVSSAPFSTASPTLPAGVYSTPDLGPIAAYTAFSAPLSSVTGMPAPTANTTYYFAAWSNVGGTWYPGEVLQFTTAANSNPSTVKVTIVKYIDGAMATATSANNSDFPMSATWNAQNIGSGTGNYALGAANNPAYQATTVDMTSGASYSTYEVTGGSVVGSACVANGAPYALTGYSVGDTLAQAQQAAPTMTAPAFTNLTSDKFVIVRNDDCSTPGTGSTGTGGLQGTVTDGVLKVDSITVVKSSSTANGTYEDGWKYIFHITAPTNESKLAMKFADWMSGSNMIPVANNMRISSAQADNSGAMITLTAANTYSTPALNMVTDLSSTMAGRQVEIIVDVKIPVGTVSGSYSTTYGVQSTP